jgi:glycosyltransferase involved in cell wall biosynthesis
MLITVVVPTRNEEANVGPVIEESKAFSNRIIVIDGHSSDQTREVAQRHGAEVFLQTSTGKGGAIVETTSLVSEGIIVFIDADQSHDPTDIPAMVAPILAGDADMVIGSRMLGGSDELFTGVREFTRLLGGHILTLLIAKRFRYPLTDSQNGFRAIRAETLAALPLRQKSFTIETEMCIEAIRHGYRVLEVPSHEYRRASGASNIDPLKLGALYVAVCLRGILRPRVTPHEPPQARVLHTYRPRWRSRRSSTSGEP